MKSDEKKKIKWRVTAVAIIHPTMVVEAESREEALEKAWIGDTLACEIEDFNLDDALF